MLQRLSHLAGLSLEMGTLISNAYVRKTIVVIFLLLNVQSYATHDVGYELAYRHVQDNSYQITLTRYRDCRLSASGPSALELACNGGVISVTTVDSTVHTELNVFCPSVQTKCNGGTTQGFLKSVYYYNVNFDNAPFASLKSCGTITVQTLIGQMITSNTPIALHEAKLELNLDTVVHNSNPRFTIDPEPILVCSRPELLRMGAVDDDGDSLSFEWGRAQNNYSNYITYTQGTYFNPLATYYPSGLSFPYNNSYADPPVGIYLNPSNGDLTFTPTSCTESTLITIMVKEWRPDSSGVPRVVGTSQRVMQYAVTSNGTNNLPTISGPTEVSVCLGDSIALNYTSGEKSTYPPTYSIRPDSVRLTWDNAIRGGQFSVVSDTVLYESAVFRWKPDSSVKLNTPYSFVITAKDNNCPLQGKITQRVNIIVRDQVVTNLQKTNLACGRVQYSLNSDVACLAGSPVYNFELLDTNGNLAPTAYGQISYQSTSNVAQVHIQQPGIYVMKATFSNDSNTYSKVYTDTLDFTRLFTARIGVRDTLVCLNDTLSLTPLVTNAIGTPTYSWSTHASDSTVNTSNTFALSLSEPNDTLVVYVSMSDATRCLIRDTAVIVNQYLKAAPMANDTFCEGDNLNVHIAGPFHDFSWNKEGGDSNYVVTNGGELRVDYTDENGCTYYDKAQFELLPAPYAGLVDTTYCGSIYMLDAGDHAETVWNNGSTNSKIDVSQNGEYSVYLKNDLGCITRDTAQVTLLNFSRRTLTLDTTQCADEIQLYAGVYDNYTWNNGSSDAILVAPNSGTYYVQVNNDNGCTRTDTVIVQLLNNPIVPRLSIESGRILSDATGKHKWFKNNTIQVGKVDNYLLTSSKGRYTALTVDEDGCESDTSEILAITLSQETLHPELFKLYPNPTAGSVTIDANGLGSIKSIQLYNANGQLVKNTQQINDSQASLQWNATNGVYWIVIRTDLGVYRAEVVSVR